MRDQGEGTGAWLPVLTFVLVFGGAVVGSILWRSNEAPVRDQVDLAPADALAVAGWRGPADLAAAGLVLRLTPLHAEPDRQAFDAGALGSRLGLDDGEPWRLELTWKPAADDVPEGIEPLLALLATQPGALGLVDDTGSCASSLSALVKDPAVRHLAGLFDPSRTLAISSLGIEGQLHLWGRRPDTGVRLTGPGFELPMTAVQIVRDELPTFVAHLDKLDR